MRIKPGEKNIIVSTVKAQDNSADVYLYGSRADDQLKGGDIDLLILSDRLQFSDKVTLLINLKEQMGDQKIDLLIKGKRESEVDPFVQQILMSAIKLT
ncbi:MAG: nucleotidyltransferase domain-containing protein [Pseudobdellovibrionaceae bacterium]|nr:nucleotidyltransferase domain-containing protein [Bdellovibrionales bacterium]USN46238.1 MAG: nucleotidyltransferase domain-containing protein [Pseudobdellovibrionaceae bacterium]